MNEIRAQIEAWKQEKSEERAIIVMAIEKEEDSLGVQGCILGKGGLIVDALTCEMLEKDKNRGYGQVLRAASSRYRLLQKMDDLCESAERIEKLAKKLGLFDDDDDKQPSEATETATDAKEGGQHE